MGRGRVRRCAEAVSGRARGRQVRPRLRACRGPTCRCVWVGRRLAVSLRRRPLRRRACASKPAGRPLTASPRPSLYPMASSPPPGLRQPAGCALPDSPWSLNSAARVAYATREVRLLLGRGVLSATGNRQPATSNRHRAEAKFEVLADPGRTSEMVARATAGPVPAIRCRLGAGLWQEAPSDGWRLDLQCMAGERRRHRPVSGPGPDQACRRSVAATVYPQRASISTSAQRVRQNPSRVSATS